MHQTRLKFVSKVLFVCLILLAVGFGHAEARGWRDAHDVSTRGNLVHTTDKQFISREEAAKRAQSRHGGRVISVHLIESGKQGAAHYRVKLLSNGNLRVVSIKASR